MKIVLLVYGIVNSSTDGRVTSAKYLASELAKQHQVTFLSTGPNENRYVQDDVDYQVVKTGDGLGFFRSVKRLVSIIRKDKPKAIEYHPPAGFNFINVTYMVLLSTISRVLGTPFVVYLWGGPTQVLKFKWLFSKIVTPTNEPGFDWVPPIVDVTTFNAAKKIKSSSKSVLFMTGAKKFTPTVFEYVLKVRGLADFIEASKELPEYEFRISVPCLESGEGRAALNGYLVQRNALSNIKVKGVEDAAVAIASADVFIFPYQNEEPLFLPQSIIEAFASSTPVIVTDLVYLRKIISNKENGLLYAKGSGSDLASKIKELENKELRSKIVKNALVDTKNYAPEASIEKLTTLIDSL